LTGYDATDKDNPKLFYHDPAGLHGKSQAFACAPVHTFEQYFARRGVVIAKPPEKTSV
jgi:hypothetical protein